MGNKLQLLNSPNTNANLTSEAAELNRLAFLYPRTTTGNITFVSTTSGITYNTASYDENQFANQGQQGMLLLLQNVLKEYNWTAEDANGKVDHTLATAENDFLVGNTGGGSWIKKTLAEVRTILSCLLTSGGNVSGEINMQDNLLTRAEIKDYSETTVTNATVTGAVTIDLTAGNVFNHTITGATTYTFSNPPASNKAGSFTLYLNFTTLYAITFPSSVKWEGDVVPTFNANKTATLSFTTLNGGSRYRGYVGAVNMTT